MWARPRKTAVSSPVESATSQASTLVPAGWLDRISAARRRPWTVA